MLANLRVSSGNKTSFPSQSFKNRKIKSVNITKMLRLLILVLFFYVLFTLISAAPDRRGDLKSEEWDSRIHGLDAYLFGDVNDNYYWDEDYEENKNSTVPCIES